MMMSKINLKVNTKKTFKSRKKGIVENLSCQKQI